MPPENNIFLKELPFSFSTAWNRALLNFNNSIEGQRVRLEAKGYKRKPTKLKIVPTGGGDMKSFSEETWVSPTGEEVTLGPTATEQGMTYALNNPKEDASENFLNDLMFAGPLLWKAGINGGFDVAKEWLPKLSFSATETVGNSLATASTSALAKDAAFAVGTTIPTIFDISNNGFNFTNATELGLSMLPVAGEIPNMWKSFRSRWTPYGFRIGNNAYGFNFGQLNSGMPISKTKLINFGEFNETTKPKIFGDYIGGGAEYEVFRGKDGKIYKVGYNDYSTLDEFNDKIIIPRNNVPGQTPLKLEGTTSDGRPVLSLEEISRVLTEEEFELIVPQYLKSMGFRYDTEDGTWTNGKIILDDVYFDNIGFSKNGNLTFFDVAAYPVKSSTLTSGKTRKFSSNQSVLEFTPSYVHESNATDLVRPGKLQDDFYNHTFNINAGDVANYFKISDYIAPIERDVNVLDKDLYRDILLYNINEGLLSENSAQEYYNAFTNSKNNISNFSSLSKEYLDAVIKSIDSNLLNRYSISSDGRIWGTFKVGDRWKGMNRKQNNGSSILYITDARNSPATIAIHEGGHGIQRSVSSLTSGIDLRTFIQNDPNKINFINSLNADELSFFKAQPPSVLNLLYGNLELFKNVPIREVTNVARDIRAMLTTKGIKTKELIYKYIKEISDNELYNMYPQTKYLEVMKQNALSKKDYVNFLKKLIIGTAFAVPVVINNIVWQQ